MNRFLLQQMSWLSVQHMNSVRSHTLLPTPLRSPRSHSRSYSKFHLELRSQYHGSTIGYVMRRFFRRVRRSDIDGLTAPLESQFVTN